MAKKSKARRNRGPDGKATRKQETVHSKASLATSNQPAPNKSVGTEAHSWFSKALGHLRRIKGSQKEQSVSGSVISDTELSNVALNDEPALRDLRLRLVGRAGDSSCRRDYLKARTDNKKLVMFDRIEGARTVSRTRAASVITTLISIIVLFFMIRYSERVGGYVSLPFSCLSWIMVVITITSGAFAIRQIDGNQLGDTLGPIPWYVLLLGEERACRDLLALTGYTFGRETTPLSDSEPIRTIGSPSLSESTQDTALSDAKPENNIIVGPKIEPPSDGGPVRTTESPAVHHSTQDTARSAPKSEDNITGRQVGPLSDSGPAQTTESPSVPEPTQDTTPRRRQTGAKDGPLSDGGPAQTTESRGPNQIKKATGANVEDNKRS